MTYTPYPPVHLTVHSLNAQDPEAFVAAMTDMFDRLDPQTIRKNTSAVFKDMIGERQ